LCFAARDVYLFRTLRTFHFVRDVGPAISTEAPSCDSLRSSLRPWV
jgi:hypothetical protein